MRTQIYPSEPLSITPSTQPESERFSARRLRAECAGGSAMSTRGTAPLGLGERGKVFPEMTENFEVALPLCGTRSRGPWGRRLTMRQGR